jgi:hypothetical protein
MSHLQSVQPKIKLVRCGERLPVYLFHILLRPGLRSHKDCSSTDQISQVAETGAICATIFSGENQERSEYCVLRMRSHAVRPSRTTELASPPLLPSPVKTSRIPQALILHHTDEPLVSAQQQDSFSMRGQVGEGGNEPVAADISVRIPPQATLTARNTAGGSHLHVMCC